MAQLAYILVMILGLALLMIVHELGHHLVARAFGMRVVRFSIGFGPALFRHQPKGSDTVYQFALIPFLAYVQIAGMNPFEESDPNDKGSYANARLTARIATIFAGPAANYLFGSVLAFIALAGFGQPETSTSVRVEPNTPAFHGDMKDDDKIVAIDGTPVATFDEMQRIIVKSANKELTINVLRDGHEVPLKVTPAPKEGDPSIGLIGVRSVLVYQPLAFQEAVRAAIAYPANVVKNLVLDLARMVTRFGETPEVTGPVGIVKYGAKMAEAGPQEMLFFLAMLSAYLGGFNLLPVPALDGGRLIFLGYEAVARRKPNARIEAQIHAVGLLMFLALIAVVTVRDFQRDPGAAKSDGKAKDKTEQAK